MKQLLFCVHDANGRGPAHCLRRGRRRRQQSPRCGPRRWPGWCSPATGRPGGRQAPGPEARAKAHDLVGARSANASAPKPNESRALDNAIDLKASSASNPRRCIASVAWLVSWLQRTCRGWGEQLWPRSRDRVRASVSDRRHAAVPHDPWREPGLAQRGPRHNCLAGARVYFSTPFSLPFLYYLSLSL